MSGFAWFSVINVAAAKMDLTGANNLEPQLELPNKISLKIFRRRYYRKIAFSTS